MGGLVSVVIPAYNAAEFLQRTVDSAINQTYENLEILIVDDGSTDETGRIAQEISEKFLHVKYLRKMNGGVSSARNFGIQAARGEYVTFLDADDLWHPLKIASQMAALEADGDRGVACFSLYRIIDLNDRVLRTSWFWPAMDFTLSPHIVIHPVGNGSSMLVRRDIALAVGGFEEDYVRLNAGGCEDLDFELKVVAKYPVKCVPEHHVGYRVYEGNMSSDRLRMSRAINMVIERHLARNPRLSSLCKKLALAKGYEYSVDNLVSRLEFRAAMKYAYKLFFYNRPALFSLVLERWPQGLVRRLVGAVRHRLGFEPVQYIGPLFLALDPKDAGPDDLWKQMRPLYDKLSAEDVSATRPPVQKSSRGYETIAKLERVR
jgi:glycosyltransferase involved in cell wall biosynthesis